MINLIPEGYPKLNGIPAGSYEERSEFFEKQYGFKVEKMSDLELNEKLEKMGFEKLESFENVKKSKETIKKDIENLKSHLKSNSCPECEKITKAQISELEKEL